MEFSKSERKILRAALDKRRDALAKAADPENPWFDPEAVFERRSIDRMLLRINARDEREDESILEAILVKIDL